MQAYEQIARAQALGIAAQLRGVGCAPALDLLAIWRECKISGPTPGSPRRAIGETPEGEASTPEILDAWQRGWLAAQEGELPPMAPAFAARAGVAWVVALELADPRAMHGGRHRAEVNALTAEQAAAAAIHWDEWLRPDRLPPGSKLVARRRVAPSQLGEAVVVAEGPAATPEALEQERNLWLEYDRAAAELALKRWEPDLSCGMFDFPVKVSPACEREIDFDPEAFAERIREQAYEIAMAEVDHHGRRVA